MAHKPQDPAAVSRKMSRIRSTGNITEVALRKALHRLGYRYRLYVKDLPGKPDIVFPTEKVAVFVDGDFWHGREFVEGGIEALTARIKAPTKAYWLPKIQRTVERDRKATDELRANGWLVLRFWESEAKGDLGAATEAVRRAVNSRRKGFH